MNKTQHVRNDKKDRNIRFGLRLKTYRQEAHITQEQLAEYVNRSSETISKMERGLIYPGVDMLILLAERLSTSLDGLVGTLHTAATSSKQTTLLAEAACILNDMNEDQLRVAVEQIKSLKSLSDQQ